MKKILFALALAGMFGFAACNSTEATENDTIDTVETADTVMVDSLEVIDSVL